MSFDDRISSMLDRVNESRGQLFSITRGTGGSAATTASPVKVTVGKTTTVQSINEDGATVRSDSRDHILPIASYVLGGQLLEPQTGDVFTDANGLKFQCRPLGSEPAWRYVDESGRTFVRCHVVRLP